MTNPPRDGLAPDFLSDLFRHPLDPGYADAAARRAEHGPRPPWRRRGAYGLKVLTLVGIGFLLAVAYREAVKAEPEATRAHAGLVTEVKSAQTATFRAIATPIRGSCRRRDTPAEAWRSDGFTHGREFLRTSDVSRSWLILCRANSR